MWKTVRNHLVAGCIGAVVTLAAVVAVGRPVGFALADLGLRIAHAGGGQTLLGDVGDEPVPAVVWR